jgi:hypothetical protein
MVCPISAKKSRNCWRISALVSIFMVIQPHWRMADS